ncbi:DUF255 domain-containing protein [Kitasatospora fiedleri]
MDWWEWGERPMSEAARRDVPILLSVGYASCHLSRRGLGPGATERWITHRELRVRRHFRESLRQLSICQHRCMVDFGAKVEGSATRRVQRLMVEGEGHIHTLPVPGAGAVAVRAGRGTPPRSTG